MAGITGGSVDLARALYDAALALTKPDADFDVEPPESPPIRFG